MSVRVVTKNSVTASASPYRLLDREREVAWANDFLDAQRLRQLSLRSLRAYAFDLLHAARWFQTKRQSLARLNQSLLLQYVHDQLQHPPQPSAQTVNHRLAVLRCLYRFHYGREIPGKTSFRRSYIPYSALGYGHGRPRPRITTTLCLRQPRRVIVPLPLTRWPVSGGGFRSSRDLAIVARCCSMACAPVKSSNSSWRIYRSPMLGSRSAARDTRSASCPCRLMLSKSSKTISTWNGP